ncbi:FKBP-type peptidyl-prolyl cis-trans isomerase [Litorilituus lipolyticus]|uniref:Peptidyl-prolyl cis-trans isomerase n=1 Tax=Litorilituus lipolyticus TaxID=2491017 RepID=A0A502KYH3_9GAMM|nr:FKBP-type peptidyl-prolyl cis-trans isomerase [Litorilituus lipolyticus]TPH15225.1 FKBP-type peptidyl-prolyl cis-trans isomerase [Litorilituus lipolyticus]
MKFFKPTLVAVALIAVTGCQEKAAEEVVEAAPVLESEVQKQAYGLGASIAMYMERNLKEHQNLGLNLDQELIIKGFIDGMDGKSIIEKEEIQQLLINLDDTMKQKQQAKITADAEASLAEGAKYLEENAKKEGVQVTESGIQYVVLEEGNGEKPSETDTVTVHYRGTFLNGETFDSSYDRNEPAVFPLNRVIKGWTEGVQLMPVGSKYKFTIPSDLAYGAGGNPPRIPGNSVLEFEIELLEIQKAEPAAEVDEQATGK